jgi:hypothetical protein
MTAPSLMTTRRFAHSTRLRLQVVFARAWEMLADTYRAQAVEFVRRLQNRLPVDEALDRYFREVGVPDAMQDTVRARALIALAPLLEEVAEPEGRTASWTSLRPDQVIEAFKRRAHHAEEVNLDCRLAASVCSEAVAATHVRMALETAELLGVEITPDEAIMHYIRAFNLASIEAQLVFRRAMAQWAERHIVPLPAPEVAAQVPGLRVCASSPQLELTPRISLGVRISG